MFKALNVEQDKKDRKADKELEILISEYIDSLRKMEVNFSIKPICDSNKAIYEKITENLKLNFIYFSDYDVILKSIGYDEIKQNQKLFFAYLGKTIENKKIVKARKMLNYAKKQKMFCKMYYDMCRMFKKSF
ncbi:hypothetical protein DMUE_5048 [Dictyocoela muelleri]|nr:hypothetical protein DMUE_5048 [Dictyocoela muelleri]